MPKNGKNRPHGRKIRGETLFELLIAIPVAAMSLILLICALSLPIGPRPTARPSGKGKIYAHFELGEADYGMEIGVLYGEEGFTYAED